MTACLLLWAIGAHAFSGAEWLARGDDYFKQRALGATEDHADRSFIVQAAQAYRFALSDVGVEQKASMHLMRALYFQGCYAYLNGHERLRVFSEAKILGEKMVIKYPKDTELAYWYTVNLSLWANEVGPLAAIRAGVADRIRSISETAMAHGTSAGIAGVYQVMGRMHHLLPRIPFLLPWPDKQKAEMYLSKAVILDPANLANHLFLAEFYRDQGRYEEAHRVVETALGRAPRTGQELEDRRSLWKLRELEVAMTSPGDPERVAMLFPK